MDKIYNSYEYLFDKTFHQINNNTGGDGDLFDKFFDLTQTKNTQKSPVFIKDISDKSRTIKLAPSIPPKNREPNIIDEIENISAQLREDFTKLNKKELIKKVDMNYNDLYGLKPENSKLYNNINTEEDDNFVPIIRLNNNKNNDDNAWNKIAVGNFMYKSEYFDDVNKTTKIFIDIIGKSPFNNITDILKNLLKHISDLYIENTISSLKKILEIYYDDDMNYNNIYRYTLIFIILYYRIVLARNKYVYIIIYELLQNISSLFDNNLLYVEIIKIIINYIENQLKKTEDIKVDKDNNIIFDTSEEEIPKVIIEKEETPEEIPKVIIEEETPKVIIEEETPKVIIEKEETSEEIPEVIIEKEETFEEEIPKNFLYNRLDEFEDFPEMLLID